MSGIRALLARLVAVFARRRDEERLDDEIAAHLDLLAAEYRHRGLSAGDARAAARRDFGGIDRAKEHVRDQRGFAWFDALRQDIAYAVRTLVRTPAFTVTFVNLQRDDPGFTSRGRLTFDVVLPLARYREPVRSWERC